MSKPASKDDRLVQGWLRPLSMPSIRILPFEDPVDRIDAAELVRDLCWNEPGEALEAIKKRYLRVSTQDLDIFVVPAENLILSKIVWPLKSAKHAFCLADFLSCIALCGAVCEMAVVFIYDLASDLWDLSKLDSRYQKIFADRKYERMGQAKRIKSLRNLGAIPNEFANDATTVREIRREYLHYLSKDYTRIEDDAYRTYTAAFRVVKSLVALPLGEQGKLAIPAHLESYLKSRGAL